MRKAIALTVMLAALCGCKHTGNSQQAGSLPVSETISAVKCNLGHFFSEPKNIVNDRYVISKVDVRVTYASSLALTGSGQLSATIPISSASLGGNLSGQNQSTTGGRFIPNFTFQTLRLRTPVADAEGKPIINPNGTPRTRATKFDELKDQAEEYAAKAKENLQNVCRDAIDIRFPQDLQDQIQSRQEAGQLEEESSPFVAFEAEENSEAVTAFERGVALSSFLNAYKEEIERIVSGAPGATTGDFTLRSDLRVQETTSGGVTINVLVLSFGATTSRVRDRMIQLQLVFDAAQPPGSTEFLATPVAIP
ncbi:MAG: hypothetical protein AAF250_04160 [Pseudomonadota bacterium]